MKSRTDRRRSGRRKDLVEENIGNHISEASASNGVHHHRRISWDQIKDDDDDFDQDNRDDDDIFNEDDDDSDMNFENNPKGLAGKIAAQAKYMKQKFGSGVEEAVDLSEEEDKKSVWGRAKNIYYGDDIGSDSHSSDSDIPMEEEEVRKIQREKAKGLTMADFGLEDLGGAAKTDKGLMDGEDSVIKLNSYNELLTDATENCEVIKKDVDLLSKEEQMSDVHSYAPEVVKLLLELKDAMDQLKTIMKIQPEICRSHSNGTGEEKYSEVKYVLPTYCQVICFYVMLKLEGCLVDQHPVKFHLVDLKKMIEKMKQNNNFTFQAEDIDNNNLSDESILLQSCGGHHLQCGVGMTDVADEVPLLAKNHLLNNPDYELPKQKVDAQLGLLRNEMLKLRTKLEEKLKQKGLCLTSVKSDDARKSSRKPVNRYFKTLDDIGDEVEQHTMSTGKTGRSSLSKPDQRAMDNIRHAKFVSGDEDLPNRDDVGERRRKHELLVLARAGAESPDGDDDGDDNEGHGSKSLDVNYDSLESENELYEDARKKKNEKILKKAKLYSGNNEVSSPAFEEASDGKRNITYQMEKNRGLTRARNKLKKNPRKKYKMMYTKATTRRKGQVQDIRKQNGAYGGETTGISTGVSRSIRFNN